MDYTDKKIFIAELSKKIGETVFEMAKKYDIDETVSIEALVDNPYCYIGEDGKANSGRLVTVYVDFVDEEKEEDDY